MKKKIGSSRSAAVQLRNLHRWNWTMFALHTVQGLVVLLLSTSFTLPMTSAFLQYDALTMRLQPTLETIANIQIGPLIAGFFFLSALAHAVVAMHFPWYSKQIQSGINPARWVEYALSSSLMIVVIALLVGLYDIATLLLLFGLNAMMILFGWMMELHNQSTKKTDWTSFWFGSIAGIIPWIAIAIYLFFSGDAGSRPPTFVYWIYLSMFLFFNSFAINMALQYKKVGPWKEYLYGERAYMILSLVAKSLLAWQVFAGTLRPV